MSKSTDSAPNFSLPVIHCWINVRIPLSLHKNLWKRLRVSLSKCIAVRPPGIWRRSFWMAAEETRHSSTQIYGFTPAFRPFVDFPWNSVQPYRREAFRGVIETVHLGTWNLRCLTLSGDFQSYTTTPRFSILYGYLFIYCQPGQVRTCGASRNGVGQVGTEACTAVFGDLSQI